MVELEKNLIIQRLAHGRAKKYEKMEQKNKKAKKVNQRLACGDITQDGKLSYAQVNQMKTAINDHKNGQFGWRVLQAGPSDCCRVQHAPLTWKPRGTPDAAEVAAKCCSRRACLARWQSG